MSYFNHKSSHIYSDMNKTLRTATNLIIYCAAGYGEETYIKLQCIEKDILCFCDNAKRLEGKTVLGKPVYSYDICRKMFPYATYIIANANYLKSILISRELELDGFIKDETYYLALELKLSKEFAFDNSIGLKKILRDKTLIVLGEPYLCNKFTLWADKILDNRVVLCPSNQYIYIYHNQYPDAIWIPLAKGYYDNENAQKKQTLLRLIDDLRECDICSYFLNHYYEYCSQYNPAAITAKSNSKIPSVRKIIFLLQSSFSGSILIDSILDSHPNILYLGYNLWGINIWTLISRIKYRNSGDLPAAIIDGIRKILSRDGTAVTDDSLEWLLDFQTILAGYFAPQIIYSEKDIYINIYLAYYELLHGTAYTSQIEPVIYMDIHSNEDIHDTMIHWFKEMGFEVILLRMIRKPHMRFGSAIKYTIGENGCITASAILHLLFHYATEFISQEQSQTPIIRIRFEDLKLDPKGILKKLCQKLNIPWSDSLLHTTISGKDFTYISNGEKTTGYDIKPVYYPYEEYFDAFDRLRLDMLFREKAIGYDYPSISDEKFQASKSYLKDSLSLPFKFERFVSFNNIEEKNKFRENLYILYHQLLYLQENKKKFNHFFEFGPILKAED